MLDENRLKLIADELSIQVNRVRAAAELLENGCTVPFIARYRKEATGSLDEVQTATIRDRLEQLAVLEQRREAIMKSLEERGLVTEELKQTVMKADSLAELEDVYLPYRPKRRTKASIARERGLEELAIKIYSQESFHLAGEVLRFVDSEKGVESSEAALAGARDIIAETINEDSGVRSAIRKLFFEKGIVRSKVISGKEDEGTRFQDYFDSSERISSAPGHRLLAMFRGEKEGVLSLQIRPSEDEALGVLRRLVLKARNEAAQQVELALVDGYKRLLAPSMETETRQGAKKRADEEAIRVFAKNLRELLLSAPLGRKRVLALDPGFRTGAKLVCLDSQGKLLHHDTIYPTQSEKMAEQAATIVKELCRRFEIEAIAVGNGTAGRETETFVRSLGLPKSITVVMVNESGASIYSASKAAREEFPDQDVTVRGAISIGRRLLDPLAELVKIDPKSIGIGQYQHDVDQTDLKRSLDDVVISCVNRVGVEVNTASKELLSYVSGLGPTLAKNIVLQRSTSGPFRTRKELLNVPRLGPKAFEQAAGFLRISDGENPLDASAVHPESYPIVEQFARNLRCSVKDLMGNEELRNKVRLEDFLSEKVGMPTLRDIMEELAKPGRDPREKFEPFHFAEGVNSIEDLKPGMKVPGIVTNVTKFGAFVDIGVHQDGLVHISQLADRFISDPTEVVKPQQRVSVTVLDVDISRKRISLSMR
ncbi:Tex family protein [Desulfomonile tiedjei]|uniref:Transcriptional accessory protein n=1 Tax=Desulfomonile tiedjei (strain ATCC 49306 / DSM 6799 / DCB-1) TaxID=706587 RepID=I4C1C6_DESTA|nr:Tex family protein [Desulfomonile tiedjei]AFM23367.1 transcriptional accessory protein [Desulfomonile tiedjei DSM 6799]